MNDQARFAEVIRKIDEANEEDPRREFGGGEPVARELLFARRVYAWVLRLVESPSEALLLAARAHTLRRWHIPRDRYPKTKAGYHAWRRALAQFHAEQAEGILMAAGYSTTMLNRVRSLIVKENWRSDPEGRALEDADCLSFLELKLKDYVDEWNDDKSVDILRKTIAKMTPQAKQLALDLDLDGRCAALLQRALSPDSPAAA